MTADGVLYVSETCRDIFQRELDKVFGKGNWSLDGDNYNDYWDLSTLPDQMEISVVDEETDEQIGIIYVKNKFKINSDGFNRWLEPNPKSCKIKDLRKKWRR